MMGSIYSTAALVVVWLGEATQNSRVFFKVNNGEKLSKIKVPVGSDQTNNRSEDLAHKLICYISDVAEDVLS